MSQLSSREERLRQHKRDSGRNFHGDYRGDNRANGRSFRSYQGRRDDNYDFRRNHNPNFNDYRDREREIRHNEELSAENKLIVKEKPNFKTSGLLAKESNNFKGIQLKYTEPNDSTDPSNSDRKFYIYSFVEDSKDPRIKDISKKSFYLIGRDDKVVDILTDHETCSKQHAVIQFRQISTVQESSGRSLNVIKHVLSFSHSSRHLFY